ncbi:MAG: two-component sensor histidine kinase [Desulfobacterales bacterium]|nr:MAG: two-component sensor histidine kinase [Desulfobacterales bacterium]
MKKSERLRPKFWDHEDVASGPYKHLFNFRRIWQRAVLITATVAIVPLVLTALFSYKQFRDSMESELLANTSRLISSSCRSVTLFLSERRAALDFIAHDNSFEMLSNPDRLNGILANLNERFGGFTDLGILDSSGLQRAYAGPHGLEGRDYKDQSWFGTASTSDAFTSEVVLGFRREPHVHLAVRRNLNGGAFFILRAALDTIKINELMAQFEVGDQGDAFIINQRGILQTPSRLFGGVLNKIDLPVPKSTTRSRVFEKRIPGDKTLLIGYSYIPETPFILMIVNHKIFASQAWYKTPWAFTVILVTSVMVILLITLAVTTRLVDQIHAADQERVRTLHQVEYANKMASLGRLAAGIAHEINNPLAIIGEKAGHIKDIFTLTETYAKDQKLIGLADSITAMVQRSGNVTRRLLNFAGHLNLSIQPIDIKEIIDEVSNMLSREAEYRCISVRLDVGGDIPQFESDRGKLEQIILNLFNYCFSSMNEGGYIEVKAELTDEGYLTITFADNSRGIPQEDVKRVFEPFFYTQAGESGTGLGLAITYALVQEIGGEISVQSRIGQGTRFTIRLPFKVTDKDERGFCPIS